MMLLLSSYAHASIFFEPMGGYTKGTFTSKIESSKEHLDLTGTAFGARGGFDSGLFQIGGDFLINSFSMENRDRDFDRNQKVNEFGVIVGFRVKYFRLYGGFISDAKSDDLKGTGIKGGLSFYLFKHLAVSAEYKKVDFDSKLVGMNLHSDGYETVTAMISFPFYLFEGMRPKKRTWESNFVDDLFKFVF